MIRVKRVYEPKAPNDGARFLVDRLWPRGVKRQDAQMVAWVKEVAPSAGLRRWFEHDPGKWREFKRRYRTELGGHPDAWEPLLQTARRRPVTLLFSARDTEHNNAVALKAYLDARLARRPRARPAKAH